MKCRPCRQNGPDKWSETKIQKIKSNQASTKNNFSTFHHGTNKRLVFPQFQSSLKKLEKEDLIGLQIEL